jgi:glucan phosphoethanolaminetransferase (alkaline phosphatase superfamily)
VSGVHRTRLAAALMFGTIALLLLPNFVWLAISDRLYFQHSVPYILMSALLPALIGVLGLFALLGRWPWLCTLLMLPFLVLVPAEVAYIAQYGEPSFYAIIATIVESNSRESIDFLGALIWPLAAATLACLVWGVVAIVVQLRSGYAWRGKWRSLTLTICITAAIMPFALAAIAPAPRSVAGAAGSPAASVSEPLPGADAIVASRVPAWLARLEPSFPFGVAVRWLRYREEWDAMRAAAERLRQFQFHAQQTASVPERQVYVLVIGETGRRDHWSMYGYARDTNPELAATPNLIKLGDVVSPWSASRMAVPLIVTRKRGSETTSVLHERTVMHAFAEAGFETYWMSNQLAVGEFDSPIAVVAHDIDHVSFYNVADWGKPGNYDEVLLQPLKQALAGKSEKLFIVLHTLGSHANYAFRYPPAFDRWTPSLKGVADPDYYIVANADRIYNSYDNSILYTDHFLAAVIDVLKQQHAIATMWYTADHGEDLITADCKFAGHGNGTLYNFPVPSVFWYSDDYAQHFAAALEQMRAHADKKITTENFFESLIDMAGLDFPGHNSSWSLFSTKWQPHQRLVHGLFEVDFDEAEVSQKCHMLWPRDINKALPAAR